MRIYLSIFLLLISTPGLARQTGPEWKTKLHHELVDGNQLYADCQEWQKGFSMSDDHMLTPNPNSGADFFAAGRCWGYVLGIVDSIPAGEGFEPDEGVRASQYVDVVVRHLRGRPELRLSVPV
jgi:hypothetical protein